MKASQTQSEHSIKLFEGERGLVLTSIIGFILAGGIAVYLFFQGPIVLPEGNVGDAFSFNAAIGIFILSIAGILPLAKFETRKRRAIRWAFIICSLYSYGVETIQNFRGISPRFSRAGDVVDTISGILFGVVSLVLITLTVILAIRFLRMKAPLERPLLIVGIRYAFVSVLVSNLAGVWMILLQDRFTGDAGNIIVLHGIGFHALQTLIFPAWLVEKAQISERLKKRLIHSGSMAWMLSILLIGIQTAIGRPVFELTILPILAGLFLLVWLGTTIIAFGQFMKQWRKHSIPANQLNIK